MSGPKFRVIKGQLRIVWLTFCLIAVRGLLKAYRISKFMISRGRPIAIHGLSKAYRFSKFIISHVIPFTRGCYEYARVSGSNVLNEFCASFRTLIRPTRQTQVRRYLAIFLSGGIIANTCSSAVWAESSMTYLDVLANVVQAFGYDVSNSGSTVVGTAMFRGGDINGMRAVKWDLVGSTYQMTNLGTLPGGYDSEAKSVSADGSVIVGYSVASNGRQNAFKWTAAGGMVSLGTMGTGDSSNGQAVSANGAVIVGVGTTVGGSSLRAFRWTQEGGMQNLGSLTGSYISSATAVSDDGSVVVGDGVIDANYTKHAFRWTQAGGMQDLGTLFVNKSSQATGVSGDGTTVVGYSGAYPTEHAFRWTTSGGTMVDLGTLNGAARSIAKAVNGDGTVVVGYSGPNDLERAFRWTLSGGTMVDLGTLEGDDASYAYGVSADGNYVVGSSFNDTANTTRAFIWHDGVMQDYAGLLVSFPALAAGTEVAMQSRADWLSSALDDTCTISVSGRYCLSFRTAQGKFYSSPTSASGWNDDDGKIRSVSFAMRLHDNWTGGLVGAVGKGPVSETVDAGGSQYAFGGFMRWSQSGQDDLHGFNLTMNFGWATGDTVTFIRGQGFADVELNTSEARITAFSTSAILSYGIDAVTGWRVSPYAGLRWQKTERLAYSEDQTTAFYASYASANSSNLAAIMGINNDLTINKRNHLRIGLGAEYDLSFKAPALTGTSNIPVAEDLDVMLGISRKVWRGILNLAHVFSIDDNKTISLSGQVSTPTYGNQVNSSLGLSFNVSF